MKNKLRNNVTIMALAIFVLAVAVWAAPSTFVSEGDFLTLTFATTSPAVGQPVIKGDAKATGAITGVCITGTGTAAENCVVATKGVYRVYVTNVGTMTPGMYVFASVNGDHEVFTTTLSDTNTGVIFGQLLEDLATGTPATVSVRLMQSGD